ncbi:unnamed protein product [Ixodes pacificus]
MTPIFCSRESVGPVLKVERVVTSRHRAIYKEARIRGTVFTDTVRDILVNMKSSALLTLTGVVLLVLLASPIEARCPSTRGVGSDCSFSRCIPRQCASRGLECCRKPCGGTWCVRGV